MITLVLVDLDNLVPHDGGSFDPIEAASVARDALPRPVRRDESREVVVVIAMNDATAGRRGVSHEALRALAAEYAERIEPARGRAAPAGVSVEIIVMPRVPEASDGALLRAALRAPSSQGAGTVGDVLLVSDDAGLQRKVGELFRAYARQRTCSRALSCWRATDRPRRRQAPTTSPVRVIDASRERESSPREPVTRPTQVVQGAHAAWARSREVQLPPCDLRTAGWRIAKEPWLRTQLSLTHRSFTGPARLGALLAGERAFIDLARDEVVDYQASSPTWGRPVTLEDVGPGTVRARWGADGAQVVRTSLPFSVVRDPPLTIDDGAAIRDSAVLRSLEGREIRADSEWKVSFSRRPHGFHCELESDAHWPPVFWQRADSGTGTTVKLAGDVLSTPHDIRGVPICLVVRGARLRAISVGGEEPVWLEDEGRPGDLVAGQGASGRCAVLCASRVAAGREVVCVPVHRLAVEVLAAHLAADALRLRREGVPELPILVAGVRDRRAPRRNDGRHQLRGPHVER